MKRILVIGPGGAGKSTFAVRLGKILGINVIHLDSLYWRPGWVEPSKGEWAENVEGLLEGVEWIIDGNYSGTLERRFAACDTVVFLDLPRHVCLWRVLKRWRGTGKLRGLTWLMDAPNDLTSNSFSGFGTTARRRGQRY